MITISGFTYVRNGFKYGYPFIPSILSLLPVVDELIVVVGDSTDGTREAIVALNEPKIKLIDTVWDEKKREGGSIFADQSNLGLAQISGQWAVHLQVDEVLHEDDQQKLRQLIYTADKDPQIERPPVPVLSFLGRLPPYP